jgi:putative flippase GtrA
VLVDWAALLGPEAANVVSLILWTIISYVVHREFTFRFDGAYGGSAARFIFIFVLKLLASMAVIAVMTRYYQSSYLIGVLLNWVVMPLISYVAMKLWVFQRALSASPAALGIQSEYMMAQIRTRSTRMRYGADSSRGRRDNARGPSSDTA